MFIKIKDLIINTDLLVVIDFGRTEFGCVLEFSNYGRSIALDESAGLYIAEMLETNTGYISNDDEDNPKSDLKGRVAVLLRDTWKSATCSLIAQILRADAGLVLEALLILIAENVVYVDSENEREPLYYHVTNKPKYLTSTPGPLIEDVMHGLIDLEADGNG